MNIIIGKYDKSVQLYNKNGTDTNNGYINNSYFDYNGNPATSGNHTISEYIDISSYNQITLSGVGTTSSSIKNVMYDANKEKVSTFYTDVVPKTVTVPQNVKYVRLTVANAKKDTLMLNAGSEAIDYEPYGYIWRNIPYARCEQATAEFISLPISILTDGRGDVHFKLDGNGIVGVGDKTLQLYNKNGTDTNNGYVNNSYLDYNGSPAASSNHTVSEYIDISEYDYITLSGVGTTSASITHAFYNESKTKISTFYNNAIPKTIAVPENAKYVRLTVSNSKKDTLMLNAGSGAVDYEPYGYKVSILSSSVNPEPIYLNRPLRKSLNGVAVDTLESSGLVTYNVDENGEPLLQPITEILTVSPITTTEGEIVIDVSTIVKPSKIDLTYHGWHNHEAVKYNNI